VASVRLTLQSSSAHSTTLRLVLVAKDQQYTSVVHDLPVANDYAFTAEALDKGGNVFARGMSTKVAITAGATAKVIIYLNEIRPTPFANSSPLVDGVSADPQSLGLDPTFSAAATWIAPDGAENGADILTVTATATSSASSPASSWTFWLVPGNLQ
jgi:hypothetical protein